LRKKLKRPFAKVLSPPEFFSALRAKHALLIIIGDDCLLHALRKGILPEIAIYDFRCMRKTISEKSQRIIRVRCPPQYSVPNPPGYITDERSSLRSHSGNIFVMGEEDLATLVALRYAPLNTLIAYGQPRKGTVLVRLDAKMKKRAKSLYSALKKTRC